MKREKQPAKISYFFGPGWKDVGSFIAELWERNTDSAKEYYENYQTKGLMSFKGVFWLMCSISVVLYGTIFFIAISSMYAVILSLFFFLVYICFSIVWLIDMAYLLRKRIFTACNECKQSSLIPTYLCPSCGAKHSNLVPGKYGILHRKCKCGKKMPSTFFNGRRNLRAVCHSCGIELKDRETVPICIPVVGGRSVGKTAFITAFSKKFVEEIAPSKGWEIEFYNESKAKIYSEIKADYKVGSTRMTDRPQDINKASSVSFSFFIKHTSFRPERLIHVYDIAGEVFTDNSENEMQKQYEYSQGIVLMIDPFSIPSVKFKYEAQLTPEDIAGIGKADTIGIVDSFFNKLREVTGLSAHKMLSIPLAIAISKVDVPGIKAVLGEEAIKKLMAEKPEEFINPLDAQDYLCREFMKVNGMESFLSGIDIKFKNHRFFACSAIGHTRDRGMYEPYGVVEIMEWLFKNADPSMNRRWKDHQYGKVPVQMNK